LKIQDGNRQTGSTYISACRLDSNEIPTARHIRGSGNPNELKILLYKPTGSVKSKMAAIKPEVIISPLAEMMEL
jgi:hypothetical protein